MKIKMLYYKKCIVLICNIFDQIDQVINVDKNSCNNPKNNDSDFFVGNESNF